MEEFRKKCFDILYENILRNIEGEIEESDKKRLKLAFDEVAILCQKYDDVISWYNLYFSCILNPVNEPEALEDKDVLEEVAEIAAMGDEAKKIYISTHIAEFTPLMKALCEVDEKNEHIGFTWMLQSDKWKLEKEVVRSKSDNEFGLYINTNLNRQQKKLDDLISNIDEDNQIRNIFATIDRKDGKRLVWRFSSIDAKEFYIKLEEYSSFNQRISISAEKFYKAYCIADNWKEKCHQLYNILQEADNEDFGKRNVRYTFLDEVENVLCSLVPVVFRKDGKVNIKPYEQWNNECDKIRAIIRDKKISFNKDGSVDVLKTIQKQFRQIYENEQYNEDEKQVYREAYADLMIDLDQIFSDYVKLVHKVVSTNKISGVNNIREIYEKYVKREKEHDN